MEKKKGFFKKAWTSIRDFEKYEEFAADKVTSAVSYILILTLIFTLIISIAYTYKFHTMLSDVENYISENIEEIKIENGNLTISANEEPIIIENEEEIFPIIIIDTSEEADVASYEEKIDLYGMGILILRDKIIVSSDFLTQVESINYSDIFTEDIENKEELLNLISGNNRTELYTLLIATIFIYLFIVYITSNLVDAIVLGVLGYLFARIVRLRLKYKATFNIGIHSLTLPIVLNLIYIIVNTFTNFTITYFQWMYTTISYIYVAVAILMIKTEIINQKIQLIRLEKIQEKVAEEEQVEEKPEKEEKDKKERNEEDKKEKDEGEQPEGSNA